MKITNKELKTQSAEIFNQTESLRNYVALIRSMDNALYEVSCLYDAIDDANPNAEKLKQHIGDLISLSAILLPRYEFDIENLSDIADGLNTSILGALE